MTEIKKKTRPWIKGILVGGFVLVLALAGIYWYYATEKFSDTKDSKSAYSISALDLIREFEKNEAEANKKYTDKIITVTGTISELEAPDTATVNVKFIDTTTGSLAIFAFQEQHLQEARQLKTGQQVSIKGSCSGGSLDGILEVVKIDFKRSALDK